MALVVGMILGLMAFVVLGVWWLFSSDPGRRRRLSRVLLVAVVAAVASGVGAVALSVWGLDELNRERTLRDADCNVPLEDGYQCRGFNDSWIECNWAFRAEGRPEEPICRRFLQRAGSRGDGEGVTDYDDVLSFDDAPCEAWGLAAGRHHCFVGTRTEPEARNEYMLAFTPDCSNAVVLRACNRSLAVAAEQRFRTR